MRLLLVFLLTTSFSIAFEQSYQQHYELHMSEVQSLDNDSKEKMRARVVSRLMEDMLRLQTKVHVPDPEPILESKIKIDEQPTEIPAGNLFDLKLLFRKKQTNFKQRNIFYLDCQLRESTLTSTLSFGSKKMLVFKQQIDHNRLHQSLSPVVERVRSRLSPPDSGGLRVSTVPDRASLYIEDIFIGKTPVTAQFLPPGQYKVSLKKDGYLERTRRITIGNQETRAIEETLSPPSGTASLQITSTPKGARVYIGPRYAGKTPLNLENIPEVELRIRVSLPGYLNQYAAAKLQANEQEQLYFSLEKGNTRDLKDKAGYLLPSIKYYDAFWGSMALGGVFFGAHIYYLTERDREKENAAINPGTASISYSAADQAQQTATLFLAASGISVICASLFYIWHLESLGEGFFSSKSSSGFSLFSKDGLAGVSWSTSF